MIFRYLIIAALTLMMFGSGGAKENTTAPAQTRAQASLTLHSYNLAPDPARENGRSLKLDGLFYETAEGRILLPEELTNTHAVIGARPGKAQLKMNDGRTVTIEITPQGKNVSVRMSAQPNTGILKWGLSLSANKTEYFTGLMERVVDGPQQASWAPGIQTAMDLRGQKVDMIVKPTTSVYAPFYLSSRGYACFIKATWPGVFDFCVEDPQRVKIQFEGSSFEFKIYTAGKSGQADSRACPGNRAIGSSSQVGVSAMALER
jgi:alpha-D-xyloside xylohydrolase